jgi:hypothetical protein
MPVQSWYPPTNGYLIFHQTLTGAEERFSSLDLYCQVCYPVSRDLAVLARPKPEDVKEDVIIAWKVKLDDLANSAQQGCHFCSLMACRFFNDRLYTFTFTSHAEKPVTGCCGSAPKGELSKDVTEAIAHLREQASGDPDSWVTLVGEKFRRNEESSYDGKIRWTAAWTSLSFEKADKLLGVRTEIVLEMYATKGEILVRVPSSFCDRVSLNLCRVQMTLQRIF